MSKNENSYDVEIDWDGLDIGVVKKAIKITSTQLWGNVRKNAPVDTGRLAGSFQLSGSNLLYTIFTNVKYSKMVNDGTGIYGKYGKPITPTNAESLSFSPVGSGLIFRRSVEGQRGQKYVQKSIEETYNQLDDIVDKAVNE